MNKIMVNLVDYLDQSPCHSFWWTDAGFDLRVCPQKWGHSTDLCDILSVRRNHIRSHMILQAGKMQFCMPMGWQERIFLQSLLGSLSW